MSPGATDVRRRLIVNADDFGQSQGITEGVIECHEHGIVTSASLMVRWPWAPAAAEYARARPTLSTGLHLDLGEWICRSGEWVPLYVVADPGDAAAVGAEILRQFETFRRLMGSDPTHIDSHQHVHRHPPASAIVSEIGARLGIPIRESSGDVMYRGGFYGQSRTGAALDEAVTVEHLLGMLRALPQGTTEIGCHPGLGQDAPGMYVVQRDQEVRALCDPRVREAIQAEEIDLISFCEIESNKSRQLPTWR